ncbi:putative extracellular solute-binding protein, family 3; glutamate/aspartate periplasmic-binding protein [Bradyrhizobium sp. ORS 285]|uniref:amino acid ABC transporter substrate-binding protein n=1 Tax=Bradyrhizobium sp. ORS 285 TaxID=115808 RepID=UPI0002408A69|nr:amino acid ABC transporter substrate-binding protein [Bradyrhizobium sp. ORS 285]CCD89182.1 putative extracellular solute-binding protein, family 3; glutamate/aspartate periplasmic-binding protein [Bradyrhizobium sp. ORS 285]SMX59437.1 putative extracellular solute-binding protein, family 3; glutamate/aspartate periplasmic-binding protein [Bradyrhizobium sp. ORS 285]
MNKARLVAYALVATVLVAPAVAEELTGTLQKVKETGTITIGYRETSLPFSYIDDNQKPLGFALDICGRIVDEIKTTLKLDKLDVKLTPVSSATRIPLMANGTIDLECASTTNNLDRQRLVSFSHTYFLTANRFVAKAASGLKTIDDLKGKTVASTSGTTNIKQLYEANTSRQLGLNIVAAKDNAEGFLMVENGRADAYVMDDILLAGLVASAKTPSDYAISTDQFSMPEPYGIMLRKDDPAFKTVVDRATAKLYTSPEIATLYAKWFMAPVPPKGVNFNFPMTAVLQKAFAQPNDSGDPKAY